MSDKNEVDSRIRPGPSAADIALAPPVELGTILFSLVEPRPGYAHEFNRWYERDHFYAGCMSGAGFFAGGRFVATRDLKQAREGNGVADDLDLSAGSYLHLYWILKGYRTSALEWSVDQVRRLARQKRMGPPTQNVSTGFYDYVRTSGAQAVPAELVLDRRYPAVQALLIDANSPAPSTDFEGAMERALATLPSSTALWFRPLPLPPNAPRIAAPVSQTELDHRWLILLFSDAPLDMSGLSQALARENTGTLRLSAAFRPIVPGVDDHSSQL